MKLTGIVSLAVLVIFLLSGCVAISAPAPLNPSASADVVADTSCGEPFQAVTAQTEAAIRAQIDAQGDTGLWGEADWPPGVWQSIAETTVRAGEQFLNRCMDAQEPLDAQTARLEQMALAARVLPEMAFTIPGRGDFLPVEMTIPQGDYRPSTQIMDVDGDGNSELILHTQLAYFSADTFFALRGGLSILYALGADGWRGAVIWPVAYFVERAPTDYSAWALDEQYLTQQDAWQVGQALQYPPAQRVQLLNLRDSDDRAYLAVSGRMPGPLDDTSELAILRWNGPQNETPAHVVLRLAWNHWCGDVPWTLLPDGSIHMAARPAFPEHGCPALEERMFVLQDGAYVAEGTAEGTPAAVSIREMAARQLHLSPDAMTVTTVEPVEWPDACLGAATAEELCAQTIVPGYRLVYTVDDDVYVFHTDTHGYQVRLVEAPEPAIGEALLTWTSPTYDGGCRTAVIGAEGVAFGRCGGVLMAGQFGAETRAAELAEFVATYVSFEAETPTAMIAFTGQGDTPATAAEQRMMAEWAEMVQYEAVGGGSDPEWGRVIVWRQGEAQPGRFESCRELAVYLSGEVRAGSCPGDPMFQQVQTRLDAAQLMTFYALHDNVQSFELETDQITGRTGRLAFLGLGLAPASEADQAAVVDFVAALAAPYDF